LISDDNEVVSLPYDVVVANDLLEPTRSPDEDNRSLYIMAGYIRFIV
jgi:hypothetical protein